MRLRRTLVLLGATALAASLAAWVAGRALVVADPLPQRADAIVVLAGSPPARTLAAADLHGHDVAPTIVLTRERRPSALTTLAAAGVEVAEPSDEAQRLLVALGVPPAAIVTLRRRAYSTASEARVIARWACRTGQHRLIVVTSPSHTRRARLVLRRALGPAIALTVRPAPADFFPARRWWRHRRAAKLVLTEYQKLAHFWLRERWRLRPCGR
jgi:uncharacterized SAM-binding protein YcdF (DUF218 family)